jgi:DNA-directed RNA polymerase subunit K/omega
MKYKVTLIARNLRALTEPTGNIYEAIAIISKRARQIALRTKEELDSKLAVLIPEDVEDQEINEENSRKRAKINSFYESMPKPPTVATEEFLAGELMYRYPEPTVATAIT